MISWVLNLSVCVFLKSDGKQACNEIVNIIEKCSLASSS